MPHRLQAPGRHPVGRRIVLKGAAIGALVFTIDGAELALTPRAARARGVPLQALGEDEAASLEALGDVLLPGAKAAGIAAYVDHQLAGDPGDALLIARSMGVAPPFVDFYRAGLKALDAASRKRHDAGFAALPEAAQIELVRLISQQTPEGWAGPPAPFFYAVTRNDAIDVVYGTVEGFERLGVPYMPHILPERSW
jgi:hypothetical protein